jgi:hypothetical protein
LSIALSTAFDLSISFCAPLFATGTCTSTFLLLKVTISFFGGVTNLRVCMSGSTTSYLMHLLGSMY